MAKMKLSTRLRKAANEKLWDGYGSCIGREIYSCIAVDEVRGPGAHDVVAATFLADMGVHINGLNEFKEFRLGPERQSVRYAWLMFAAMYAEELGK